VDDADERVFDMAGEPLPTAVVTSSAGSLSHRASWSASDQRLFLLGAAAEPLGDCFSIRSWRSEMCRWAIQSACTLVNWRIRDLQRLCDFYFSLFFLGFSITVLKIIIGESGAQHATWKAGEEAEAGEVLFFPGHHLVMMIFYSIFTLTRIRQLH
jgi:hypothetical protein